MDQFTDLLPNHLDMVVQEHFDARTLESIVQSLWAKFQSLKGQSPFQMLLNLPQNCDQVVFSIIDSFIQIILLSVRPNTFIFGTYNISVWGMCYINPYFYYIKS